jgi:predicted molibdopterin-dependent oxidoreductase YjgC
MKYQKDIELIKELEPELERFQKKFVEYKNRIAKSMIGDGEPYRVKERAAIKRAAEDLKQILYKINKLSE